LAVYAFAVVTSYTLGTFTATVDSTLAAFELNGTLQKLWDKDAGVFGMASNDPAAVGYMGWMDIAKVVRSRVAEVTAFVEEVTAAGFERVVLLGMGGSSLAPLVISDVLYVPGKGLPITVLDSTHPSWVLEVEKGGDLAKTLFIVASKSGSTAEPVAFDDYFFDAVRKIKGDRVGENFVAITDPNTLLEASAAERKFRKTFVNWADIGGRFSALSFFGMVPAALMGIDIADVLDRAEKMVDANRADNQTANAPGVVLGVVLGEFALKGIDKLTLVTPGKFGSFGLWLEQLIAESTGKHGKGVLPIAGEPLAGPEAYGKDRLFAHLFVGSSPDQTKVDALKSAGFPVIEIEMGDDLNLGAEFYRWEIATAVAAIPLQVNPFDQPNVQESKDVTKKLIGIIEKDGKLPPETPTSVHDGLSYFGSQTDLGSLLSNLKPGSYVALMAYLHESPELHAELVALQGAIRDKYKVAVSLGYGPRFLHSTGQFHKGGPDVGLFVQLTGTYLEQAALPGRAYGFAELCAAQAIGDRQALAAKGRSAIRLEMGKDICANLRTLRKQI
jgi:glucose-6-phosphate isomerase